MKIIPHLNFDGKCEEAFEFYEEALGGEIIFKMRYGESPMAKDAPKGWERKIIHLSFLVGDQTLQGADAPAKFYAKPQGYSVSLDIADPGEAERVYNALSKGAKSVHMKLQETFWAQRFAMFVDRYGTPWMINCGKPRDPME